MGKARNKKGRARGRSETTPPERTPAEELQALVTEFGALVEESIAIVLLQEQGYQKARDTLGILSANVRAEEASVFNAGGPLGAGGSSCGTGGGVALADPAADPSDRALCLSSRSSRRTPASGSWATESSGDSGSSQGSPLSGVSGGGALDDWQAVARDLPADGASTVAILKSAFPTLNETDIKYALKEAGNDVDKASDLLLNFEHLELTGQRPKGIDAFFQPDDAGGGPQTRRSKNKNKNKNKNSAASPRSPKAGREIPLALDYTLVPVQLGDEDEAGSGVDLGTSSAPPPATLGAAAAARLADTQRAAQHTRELSSQSFAQASAAARRGRSDPLFRQAAIVFAERGHEQARAARVAESRAAEALVDGQSSASTVDVHYVPVHDGVRIAVDRTRQWWAHLGEDRVRAARDRPLQVVTGVGLHSARGYSRMYGEVGAALQRDGWKLEPGRGHYYVTGKK